MRQRWEYIHGTITFSGTVLLKEHYYKHGEISDDDSSATSYGLGELGKMGWELVTVCQSTRYNGTGCEVAYFKRPIADYK
jgi:hypothetical protein